MAEDSIDASSRSRKEAMNERRRAEYAANPDKQRESSRARYAADPAKHIRAVRARYAANLDKVRAESRSYRSANSEAIAKRKRDRYAENPLKQRQAASKWAKSNPTAVCIIQRARRARKINADGVHTAADIDTIRKAQKDRCAYCRVKLRGAGHVDHVIALSKGGSNWPSNLQLLCRPCNISKSARDPLAFAQSLGKLL